MSVSRVTKTYKHGSKVEKKIVHPESDKKGSVKAQTGKETSAKSTKNG